MDGHGKGLLGLLAWPRGLERDAVKRDIAFRVSRHFVRALTIEVDGIQFYLDTSDRVVSREVFIYGMYERPLMATALSALSDHGFGDRLRGRLLLDIGANIGTASMTAIRYFGAAGSLAFEADPRNFRILGLNRALNGFEERIHAFDVALSDRPGTVSFERSTWNFGDNRVRIDGIESADAFDEGSREVIEVRAAPLDDILEEQGGDWGLERCGLAWIDVQGHEAHVLSGAASLLASGIPIVVEYWPYGLRAANGLERLNDLIESSYDSFVDLRPRGSSVPRSAPVSKLELLQESLAGPEDDTDLLLLPRRR
jgi:FkbM family methyltransferase